MNQFQVLLLGPAHATVDGEPVPLGGSRRAGLLAALALAHPRPLSRSQIVDDVWGDSPPEGAANTVQVHVAALRRVLGKDAILTHGDGYRLSPAAALDTAEFAEALTRGKAAFAQGRVGEAATTLRKAVAGWRGPALADLEPTPNLAAHAARLEEMRSVAQEALFEAELAAGRGPQILPELQEAVARQPLREHLRGLLMRALYHAGRQADALSVYDQGRRKLRDELGLEPSAALRELHQRILNQAEDAPAGNASIAASRRLPVVLDETVGRDDELVALAGLLGVGRARLVTVVGPGGVGKSRLALETAHRLAPHFRDGAALVPLVEAEKPADVAATICQAISLDAGLDAEEALRRSLAAREMLLVLDNFDHVLDASALVTSLLANAPALVLLVTSRARLGVRGERLYHLDPLATLPDTSGRSPACRLFLARADAADEGMPTDAVELAEQISARCDGLPLAIELAAARTAALSLAELADRLSSPLAVLTSGPRDLPAHQRTLRHSIGWSVEDTPAGAQELLGALAMFRGEFTLAAAAAVAGLDPADALTRLEMLLDRSLVRRALDRSRSGAGFQVLETVRQYCAERLNPSAEQVLRERHARYYRELIEPVPEPEGRLLSATALAERVVERANLRAAIRWALAGPDTALAADLVVAALPLWSYLGPSDEMESWLEQLLARADLDPGRRIDALYGQSYRGERAGDLDGMAAAATEALALAVRHGDDLRRGWILTIVSRHADLTGDLDAAERTITECWDLVKTSDAVLLRASCLNLWGIIVTEQGGPDAWVRGAALTRDGLDLLRPHDEALLSPILLLNLSEYVASAGHPDEAKMIADEGLTLAQRSGAGEERSAGLYCMRGYARLLVGRPDEARADLRRALRGDLARGYLMYALEDLLFLAAASVDDNPADATTYLGVFDEGRTVPVSATQALVRVQFLDALPSRLGSRYPQLYERGRQQVRDRTLHWVLVEINAGLAEWHDPAES